MDDDSLRLRLAARAIFEACFPADDFDRSEAGGFLTHRSALAAAECALEVRAADLPLRRYLTADAVAFEIRFALGQAPASLFVDARSKDRSKREHALSRPTDLVAARFAGVEMSNKLRPGWTESPFAHISNARKTPTSVAPNEDG